MAYLEELRAQIKAIRQPNFERRRFIPHRSLCALMDDYTVRKAIQECGIAPYHVQETSDAVIRGAHRIFAILVLLGKAELISKFIEHDQFQHSQLDHKLPYRREHLETLLPKSDAEGFEENNGNLPPPFSTSKSFLGY